MSVPSPEAFLADSDEDEMEWEEVVPETSAPAPQDLMIDLEEITPGRQDIEITLKAHPDKGKNKEKCVVNGKRERTRAHLAGVGRNQEDHHPPSERFALTLTK